MKNIIIVIGLSLFCFVCKVEAQTVTSITPLNAYIFLTSEKASERNEALTYINRNTKNIEPHTLLMMASSVYASGNKNSSVYWFYLGNIRTQYFVSLFKETSASVLYFALSQGIGEQIIPYTVKHPVTRKKIKEALEWDKNNPLDPTPFMENPGDTTKYIPKAQWQEHYDLVRKSYLNYLKIYSTKKYKKKLKNSND